MIYLIANLWLPMLLSAVLGMGTGWWIWRGRSAELSDDMPGYVAAPVIPPAPPEPRPEALSEPETSPEPEPETPDTAEIEPPPVIKPAPEPPVETEVPAETEAPVATETPPSPFMSAPDGEPDTLTLIKGVGPKLSDMLHDLGVFHFTQIAGWDNDQIAEVDSHLGSFKGRIERDRWVDQARLLAARNVAAFEREFGKMNGPL
ncbi:MAG: hypothetical protein AAGE05_12875 [Pseudomonadota bacterium]